MEALFKCKFTGVIFDNQLDCQESEYLHGQEHSKFLNLVNLFLDSIEKKFDILVKRETINVSDTNKNYCDDRMIHHRHLGFTFVINGRNKEYYKTSDRVGDGRWEWDVTTLDDMINDFEKVHLFKLRKKFTGKIQLRYDNNYHSKQNYYIDDKKIDDIIALEF
jgi:hypothetical protein